VNSSVNKGNYKRLYIEILSTNSTCRRGHNSYDRMAYEVPRNLDNTGLHHTVKRKYLHGK